MINKKVAVLMSTYNGEQYVKEQIDSILLQINIDVTIFIRDDGSSDLTQAIIREYDNKKVIMVSSAGNLGYGRSFFQIIYSVPKNFDYYCFADQDDYWLPNKLDQAIKSLSISKNNYQLYFSALNAVDKNLNFLKKKTFSDMIISLGSSFVRNRTAGCTYVFNNALFQLVRGYDVLNYDKLVEHDAIIYKLCLAVDGEVIYDKNTYINYRQHSDNVTGTSQGIKKRVKREILNQFFDNKQKNLMNYTAGRMVAYLGEIEIHSENLKLLKLISSYKYSFNRRIQLLTNMQLKSGVLLFDLKNKFEILFGIF